MQVLAVLLGLALVPVSLSLSIPDLALDKRQRDPQCDAKAPLPLGQYINETYYHAHEGPVTVSVGVNGGRRNKSPPSSMAGKSNALDRTREVSG